MTSDRLIPTLPPRYLPRHMSDPSKKNVIKLPQLVNTDVFRVAGRAGLISPVYVDIKKVGIISLTDIAFSQTVEKATRVPDYLVVPEDANNPDNLFANMPMSDELLQEISTSENDPAI
ncbi:hypothetical protein FHETE_5605 [Fusarium heterosporum]|uniref:Uncharacterized protein n=1 Tax=Fusarium heterosporum TaxID=42747 RepID=A0A8H5WLQ7_FUSHE|nr:hypothetical protein FHETE_5605 [Fusarium heterosporum]